MRNLTKLVGSSPPTPGWAYRSLPASPQSPGSPPLSATRLIPLFSTSITGRVPIRHHFVHFMRPCVRSVGLLTRLTMTLAEEQSLADVRVVHREVPTLCCSDARMRRTEAPLPGETEIQVQFQVCVRFWGPSKSGVFTGSRVRPTGVDIVRGMGKTDLGAP